jgi:hypothetical protein
MSSRDEVVTFTITLPAATHAALKQLQSYLGKSSIEETILAALAAEQSHIRFDPYDTHRLKLPMGVEGIPSPSADNWAYDGCRFFWIRPGKPRQEIFAGDMITVPTSSLLVEV